MHIYASIIQSQVCLLVMRTITIPNSLLEIFNLEQIILDAGLNPFYMEQFGFWVLYIKYLMSIPIMVLLSLLLRIKLHDILKQNCNLPALSCFHAALHTASLIQIHQATLIQLPPLQYVRETLAAAKHFPSAHRVCFHIPISPPQHTNGHQGSQEVTLQGIYKLPVC